MKSFFPLICVAALTLTACKEEAELQNSATPTNVVPFTEIGKQMKSETTANQVQQVTNTTTPTNTVPANTTVGPGQNPPHGQPLHRCDIPVGAPLNSPVAKATTTPKPAIQQQTQSISTPIQVPAAPAVATTPTPEGMNPPHGQTNHRCDIAVGAPLPKT